MSYSQATGMNGLNDNESGGGGPIISLASLGSRPISPFPTMVLLQL
jgi:hypothetical protein